MLHVRHAVAALTTGQCNTVLITHGESGRSGVSRDGFGRAPASLSGQFEMPYGPVGPPTLFTLPVLRYMKNYGMSHEQLAMVAVVQRQWASMNPRASFQEPISVMMYWHQNDRLSISLAGMLLVTDGGGALILTRAERAKEFPQPPVYIKGTGESVETPMISQMQDLTSSRAFTVHGPAAMIDARISHSDVDHLMVYDAFAHLPIYGLEDLGLFVTEVKRLISSGAKYCTRRFVADEHQRRRLVLYALWHVRNVCIAGKRAPSSRHGGGTQVGDVNVSLCLRRWGYVWRCRMCRFCQRARLVFQHNQRTSL